MKRPIRRAQRLRSAPLAAFAAILGSLALSAPALALTAPVTAGPPARLSFAHLDYNGFFPKQTKIHVGDSISFAVNGFHTISFLSGQARPPLIIPGTSLVEGKLDAEGKPFWFNGQPNLVVNPVVAAPAGGTSYAGTGYLSSGLPTPGPNPPPPFVVTFTKAGVFSYYCLVHPGMKGTVQVLGAGAKVPSAAEDKNLAKAQAAGVAAEAKQLGKYKPSARVVLAGHDGHGAVAWLRFFPEHLTVKAGTTVDFRVDSGREVHTITVGPAAYTEQIETTFTTPVPNPTGPPTLLINPLAGYPSDPPPLPPFTGANHGNGFANSGILGRGGPLHPSVSIRFTKPGLYHFECVIHPKMDGTITVTRASVFLCRRVLGFSRVAGLRSGS